MKTFLRSLLKKLLDESRPPQHSLNPESLVGELPPGSESLLVNEGDYSPAFRLTRGASEAPRPELFDPALKHFARALRHGEPVFEDPELGDSWRNARRQVIDGLLRALAATQLRGRLLLRGSLLLKLWLGDEARNPGDVDWVVLPAGCHVRDAASKEFLRQVVEVVGAAAISSQVGVVRKKIVVEEIWAYDRMPGMRVLVPWEADGLPLGTVQMDFVFGESVPGEPEWIDYPTVDGSTVKLMAATREASLVWKLVWLITDRYPQGKDLFDAVLLARTVVPSLTVLQAALLRSDNRIERLEPRFPLSWEVDWKNFLLDYPDISGSPEDWQRELAERLKPMFDAAPPPADDPLRLR